MQRSANPHVAMRASISTLGGLRIIDGDDRLASLTGKPHRCALLLMIAVEENPTRDVLMGRLWPDRAPKQARHLLSQTLYELRRDLPSSWCVAEGEILHLAEDVHVDVREFEACIEQDRPRDALRLYQGEFLASIYLSVSNEFEFWVDLHRARLRRHHRKARRAAFADLRTRDPAAALSVAREWVELEPLDDEAQLNHIEMLAESGARVEAIEQYEQYEKLLEQDEIGLEPIDELKDLIARIRSGEVSHPLPARPVRAKTETRSVVVTDEADRSGHTMGIAVMPFANLSSERDTDYLSDGMADELIYTLGRVRELRTASRTSSYALHGKGLDARDIGRTLNVRWLVEGSVHKAGNRVRITAKLFDVRDESLLWLDRYERAHDDVLGIQDEIAGSIAHSLLDRIGIAARPMVARREPVHPEAYHHYLLGRYHWNRRDPPSLERAVEAFQTSLESDPGYARTWSGLADVYLAQAQFAYRAPLEVMPLAEEASDRALGLDYSLAEAHTNRAHILDSFHWRWAEAEDEYRRAIALDARYATAHAWYAGLLCAVGEHERSAEVVRRAADLEPLSVPIAFQEGSDLYRAREFDRAVPILRRALEMDPTFFAAGVFLALTHTAAGRPEQGAAIAAKVLERAPFPPVLMALGQAQAVLGNIEEAEAMVQRLEQLSAQRFVSAALPAIVHAWLGRLDEAFDWIGRACEQRYGQFIYLAVDPAFDPLRADPRIEEPLRRMGLDAVPSGMPTTGGRTRS